MERLSPDQLFAYVDGQCPAEEKAAIERQLAGDAYSRARVRELQALRESLGSCLKPTPSPVFQKSVESAIENPAHSHPWPIYASIAAVLALVFGLSGVLTSPGGAPPNDGFQARGGPSQQSAAERYLGIEVSIHPRSQRFNPHIAAAQDALTPGDGLSFVVFNRSQRATHLVLFGVDASGGLHWFYPAVEPSDPTDAAPMSLAIAAPPSVHPLPEGISPGVLPMGRFQIVALFSPEPLSIDRVQSAMSSGLVQLAQELPSVSLQTLELVAGPPTSE